MASSSVDKHYKPSSTSGAHISYWLTSVDRPSFPKLDRDTECDVLVIGAGITGISTAYHLAKEHQRVILVDDGEIGSGETGRTTAHLMTGLDDRYFNIKSVHGAEGAALAANSHATAIDDIESNCKNEKIDCDFVRLNGYLFNPPPEKFDPSMLEKELVAAHDAGLLNVELADRAPIEQYNTGKALLFPNQAQFHPMKYIIGLAQASVRYGTQIYLNTHIQEVKGGKEQCECKTKDGHKIYSKWVVEATNVPISNRLLVHAKQEPYRSYVIAARIPKSAVTLGLYWDTENPYHYVRFAPLPDNPQELLLISGGEDHKVGFELDTAEERYARLEYWTRERWPQMGPVEYRWSGQVIEPADLLAYTGRNPMDECVLIHTSDSGTGITHGAMAGILLTDIILDRENKWEGLYDPSRLRLKGMGEALKHDVEINLQYKDYLTSGDIHDIEDLPKCAGAIYRKGLHKYAVYRDEQGQLHVCSAVCPHLGGLVRWNPDEQSWDCPVHGSRFSRYGKVMNGPAKSDLDPRDPAKL